MENLCSVCDEKGDYREKKEGHEAERFADEGTGFQRVAFSSCFGNSWKKNHGERCKKIIGDTPDSDSGIVEAGKMIVLEECFDEVQIDSQEELVKNKEKRQWSGVNKNSFGREIKIIFFIFCSVTELAFDIEFVDEERCAKSEKRSEDIATDRSIETKKYRSESDKSDACKGANDFDYSLELEEMETDEIVVIKGRRSESRYNE